MADVSGTEIDLMPTDGMREEAQRYRDWKDEGRDGGTAVAAARATQILSGDELSPDTVITMAAWFARHEVDKQGEGFSPGEDGYPSAGRVAWAAWGGDPGQTWANAKAERIKSLQDDRSGAATLNREQELAPMLELRELNSQPLRRVATFDYATAARAGAADGEVSRTLQFSFSSEAPVDRWFGREVLSHAPGAADLSRLQTGAAHLWNHNRDVVLGVVTSAEIGADRMGVVTTRWSPNTAITGSEEARRRADIEAGITRKVSFAYEIREAVDIGEGLVLITKWSPLEVSTVSIPADNTVGHDAPRSRAANEPAQPAPQNDLATLERNTSAPPEIMTVETVNDAASAAQAERERIQGIQNLCRQHGMPEGMATDLINAGSDMATAREQVLDKVGKRSRELQPGGLHVEPDALLGMDRRDLQRYSIVKLLRYLADPSNASARDAAGFELELSRATEQKEGRSANGALVPFDWMVYSRANVGTFSAGGALVGTELLAGSFIDLLRNQSALLQSGITTLTGLTGNVDIPRKTAASQHYWVGEDVDVTASDATFGLISSTPKTIGVRVPVSRRALIQTTPDIDTLIRSDMAESLALGLDSSGLYGSGSSGQPLGLTNVTGIGSVTLGGGASQVYPATLGGGTHDSGDWTDYIQLLGACLAANVTPTNFRYIMNSQTMVGGMITLRASAAGADYIINDAGNIGRYPAQMSNQVQTNDVFAGVFSDLILATWSGLDIVVDPYTQSAKGQVIYTVMQDIDWVCRRAASFARGT